MPYHLEYVPSPIAAAKTGTGPTTIIHNNTPHCKKHLQKWFWAEIKHQHLPWLPLYTTINESFTSLRPTTPHNVRLGSATIRVWFTDQ